MIHCVVFCAIDYEHLLLDHLASVDQYVQDTIISKTVVSNARIKVPNDCVLVHDDEIWQNFDKDFKYKQLYDHSWIKQQILKLHLDTLMQGDILLSDVEVRYTKPITWFDMHNKYKQFVTTNLVDNHNNINSNTVTEKLLGYCNGFGYVTESQIWQTDLLVELRNCIEQYRGKTFLQAVEDVVFSTTPHGMFSEYDIYNNFIAQCKQDLLSETLELKTNRHFYSVVPAMTTTNTRSITQLICAYNRVKASHWPDIYCLDDFERLPQKIRTELREAYGIEYP